MSITQRDDDIYLGQLSDFLADTPSTTPSIEEEPRKKVQRPPSKNKGISLSEHMKVTDPEFNGDDAQIALTRYVLQLTTKRLLPDVPNQSEK